MQLIFLGTGAGAPTLQRNVAAVVLRLPQRSELWLFDCGEATQHRFMSAPVSMARVTRVFLSHLHGDHVFGLPGLLATRGLNGIETPLAVYGPPGTRGLLEGVLAATSTALSYELTIREVEPGLVHDDGGFSVRCAPLAHGITTYAYRIDERDQQGHLDAERATRHGVPAGPLLGQLKRGEAVRLDDGRIVQPEDVLGPTVRGRSVMYCTDTAYCPAAVELARGCDLLVHEATFAGSDSDLADASGHSTAATAGRVAREAGVKRLVLTHISARYAAQNPVDLPDLLREACMVFPDTIVAEDMMIVDVNRPGRDAM